MARPDLLALSLDDLTALTNRGTVKRAEREVTSNEVSGELSEAADGTVTARWSDGVECRLPAGVALPDARCSCVATSLCRHLVRTVLAYQRQAAAAAPAETTPEAWDPGAITDDELARHFRKPALARARERFRQGVLAELVRGNKPTARFHVPACTLRFLVPGDVRYTHCDCADEPPCGHAPLAVWAFRMLDAAQAAGLVATEEGLPAVPAALLDDLDAALQELLEHGLAGAAGAWKDRVVRLQGQCLDADLVWPADIVAELVQQYERYAGHDARFAPDRVAELAGEVLIRGDALRANTGALPQLFVRGTSADRPTELGTSRFIGLGCGVRQGRKAVELTAYLQDASSGAVAAVSREVADAEGGEPADYWRLAQAPVLKGVALAGLGAGQLLLQGGKRTASHRLLPGRARASVNPQAFAWESLRPPVLVEEFAELRAHLGCMPPASLRPRRLTEDFHVCTVAAGEQVRFDPVSQSVRAVLKDPRGETALLDHPYTSRGAEGAEVLLAALTHRSRGLRFVAGQVRLAAAGVVIQPAALVFEERGTRTLVQPWVDRWQEVKKKGRSAAAGAGRPTNVVEEYLRQLLAALGELFLMGLRRADAQAARAWQELTRQGEALGFDRLAGRVGVLAGELEQKVRTARWDAQPAGRAALELAVLARLAQDVGVG